MTDALDQVKRSQADDGRTTAELTEAYRSGPAKLAAAVDDMNAEQLLARPVEGKMSTLEVLAHVADCEAFLADRMRRTIATDRPLLVGVDPTEWPAALGYQQRDPEAQLRLVELIRESMAADLERLPAEAWERAGVHTETGLVTLRQQVLHTVRHLEWHVGTIEEKRAALGA